MSCLWRCDHECAGVLTMSDFQITIEPTEVTVEVATSTVTSRVAASSSRLSPLSSGLLFGWRGRPDLGRSRRGSLGPEGGEASQRRSPSCSTRLKLRRGRFGPYTFDSSAGALSGHLVTCDPCATIHQSATFPARDAALKVNAGGTDVEFRAYRRRQDMLRQRPRVLGRVRQRHQLRRCQGRSQRLRRATPRATSY